jgi:glucose/arabinose dehydrogenase
VVGSGARGFSGDGGPPASASLAGPIGVAVAVDGSLYIADSSNGRIRRVVFDTALRR